MRTGGGDGAGVVVSPGAVGSGPLVVGGVVAAGAVATDVVAGGPLVTGGRTLTAGWVAVSVECVLFVEAAATAAAVVSRGKTRPSARCECGAPIFWGAKFCGQCGRPVAEAPALPIES